MTPVSQEWRSVVGHEGLYEVSDYGRVRSVDRLTPYRGRTRRNRGRVLAYRVNAHGYPIADLRRDAGRETRGVHLLVLEAFVGPRPPGMFACHSDDDPANSHLSNLRWATPSENNLDMVRNGVHPNATKKRCPLGHPLVAPNVRLQSPNKVGHQPRRNCLACQRAQNNVRYWGRRGVVLDLAAVADDHYARIMKE